MPKTIFSTGQTCPQKLLRQIRREAGLTQAGLAIRLKEHQSFVSKYEIGERRLDLIELRHISHALGLSLSDLVKRFERSLKFSESKDDQT